MTSGILEPLWEEQIGCSKRQWGYVFKRGVRFRDLRMSVMIQKKSVEHLPCSRCLVYNSEQRDKIPFFCGADILAGMRWGH